MWGICTRDGLVSIIDLSFLSCVCFFLVPFGLEFSGQLLVRQLLVLLSFWFLSLYRWWLFWLYCLIRT